MFFLRKISLMPSRLAISFFLKGSIESFARQKAQLTGENLPVEPLNYIRAKFLIAQKKEVAAAVSYGFSIFFDLFRHYILSIQFMFIFMAIFSPIWGGAADKYGRKPMLLRASLGMAVIVTCMGYVQNVYQLLGLRLLQGTVSGFYSASITCMNGLLLRPTK